MTDPSSSAAGSAEKPGCGSLVKRVVRYKLLPACCPTRVVLAVIFVAVIIGLLQGARLMKKRATPDKIDLRRGSSVNGRFSKYNNNKGFSNTKKDQAFRPGSKVWTMNKKGAWSNGKSELPKSEWGKAPLGNKDKPPTSGSQWGKASMANTKKTEGASRGFQSKDTTSTQWGKAPVANEKRTEMGKQGFQSKDKPFGSASQWGKTSVTNGKPSRMSGQGFQSKEKPSGPESQWGKASIATDKRSEIGNRGFQSRDKPSTSNWGKASLANGKRNEMGNRGFQSRDKPSTLNWGKASLANGKRSEIGNGGFQSRDKPSRPESKWGKISLANGKRREMGNGGFQSRDKPSIPESKWGKTSLANGKRSEMGNRGFQSRDKPSTPEAKWGKASLANGKRTEMGNRGFQSRDKPSVPESQRGQTSMTKQGFSEVGNRGFQSKDKPFPGTQWGKKANLNPEQGQSTQNRPKVNNPGNPFVGARRSNSSVYRQQGVRVESARGRVGKFPESALQKRRKSRVRQACGLPSDGAGEKQPSVLERARHLSDFALNHILVDEAHNLLFCLAPGVNNLAITTQLLALTGLPATKAVSSVSLNLRRLWDAGMRPLKFYPFDSVVKKLQTFDSFMFVRDPMERLWLAYQREFTKGASLDYKKRMDVKTEAQIYDRKGPLYGRDSTTNYNSGLGKTRTVTGNVTFIDFLKYVTRKQPSTYKDMWQTYGRLCDPCRVRYSFIGKMETAADDMTTLRRSIFPPGKTPAMTPRTPETSMPPAVRSALPDTLRSAILRIYKEDSRMFSY